MVLMGVIALAVSVLVLWIVLAVAVFVARPRGEAQRNAVRFFVPKVIRLTWALAHDRRLRLGVRCRLWLAIAYSVQPINLIPDFIPVIGFADNVVVLAWALRSTVRLAGDAIVAEHWTGSPDELTALYRVMRLTPAPSPTAVRPESPSGHSVRLHRTRHTRRVS